MKERQKAVDSYTASDNTASVSENQDKLDFIQRVKTEKQNQKYKELEMQDTDLNKQLNDHNCLEVSSKDQKRKEQCQALSEQLRKVEDQLHSMDKITDIGDVQIFMSDKKRQSLESGTVWQESNAITMAKRAAMQYL